MLYFVAAHDQNFGIGNHSHLPWPRMAADITRFHELIKGKTIVMGQKTYLEYKRAKHTFNTEEVFVLSSTLKSLPDAQVLHDLKDILELSKSKEVWVIGGGSLFTQLLSKVDTMYLTRIEAQFKADTYFPKYNQKDWKVDEQRFKAHKDNPFSYSFLKLSRIS